MAENKRTSKISQIPTVQLNQLSSAVARVDENVKTIKEILLPPLAADTREARDKAREALTKVDHHVDDVNEHRHECDEKERQARQDTDLAAMRPRVKSLGKLVWWIVGMLVLGLSSAVGFAMLTRVTATENATRIEALGEDVSEVSDDVESLSKAQQRDRELLIRELRAIPSKVSEQVMTDAPPVERVEKAMGDLPLMPHERRQLRSLLDRARSRGEPDGGFGG